jgi:hypothetical protein
MIPIYSGVLQSHTVMFSADEGLLIMTLVKRVAMSMEEVAI